MNTAPKTIKPKDDAEAIADEVAQIRKDLSSLVDTVGKIGKARAETMAETASETAASAKAAGQKALVDIENELRSVERGVVTATRDNPFRALGFAMLAGFLAGLLFKR